MLSDHRPGVDWVVGRVQALSREWNGPVIVETTGTAGFLTQALENASVNVNLVARRFYVDACANLDALVGARQLRHFNHGDLNAAVAVARWSTSGEAGHRLLSRKDPRVSGLVAAALALHGLTAPGFRPGKFFWIGGAEQVTENLGGGVHIRW